MQDKKWAGADLVFDLDADTLFTGSVPSYAYMLRAVKKETSRLLDFLMHDFGFEPAEFSIVFSGGRGYHVHVHESRLGTLGSHERREVVNYLTGTGLEPEYLVKRTTLGSPNNSSCWGIRISFWIKNYFESLLELESEAAVAKLATLKAIGKRRAQDIVNVLSQGSTIQPLVETKLMPSTAWKSLVREGITQMKVNIDVPVTADTKRLIRLPTSLHGGSGLRVTPLTLDDFSNFDPLRDAVVFGENSVPVTILKPVTAEIMGETIKAHQGKTSLPEHTAVYLMARGLAEYESR
jgi:DNA primase small subunit